MVKLLIQLLDDPSADLLVLSGLVILGVAILGNLNDRSDPGQGRRMMLSLIGCLCVALGFLVYANHALTASADSSNSPAAYNLSAAALDPASATFSSSAVDKYLGKPNAPPEYFGEMQVTAATFLGNWTNLGETPLSSIRRMRILLDDGRLLVHLWGRCQPVDCDWGEQTAALDDETARVSFGMRTPDRQFTLIPTPSGELEVEVVNKTPGKPSQVTQSVFANAN